MSNLHMNLYMYIYICSTYTYVCVRIHIQKKTKKIYLQQAQHLFARQERASITDQRTLRHSEAAVWESLPMDFPGGTTVER